MKKPYVKPALREHGSVESITLAEKVFGESDGFTFQGQGLATVS